MAGPDLFRSRGVLTAADAAFGQSLAIWLTAAWRYARQLAGAGREPVTTTRQRARRGRALFIPAAQPSDHRGQNRRAIDMDRRAADAGPHRRDGRRTAAAQRHRDGQRRWDAAGGRGHLFVIRERGVGALHRTADLNAEIAAWKVIARRIGIGDVEDDQSRLPDALGKRQREARHRRP